MPNRTARFTSAILVSLLAGLPLTTIPGGAAPAADDCLSAPGEQTQQGGHWYYRIDHATKRHCWYLRDENGDVSKVTAPGPRQSAKPASKAEGAMQSSIADARAEFPAQTRVEVPSRAVDAPPTSAPATIWQNDSNIPGPEPQRSVIASRWPDSLSDAPSISTAPARADAGAAINAASRTEAAVAAAGQISAADTSPRASTHFTPMQLAAMAIATLALAGIVGSLVFRLRSAGHSAQAKIRRRRGTGWETTDDDSIVLSDYGDALPRRRGFAREADNAGDRNARIADFFSQLSKRRPA
jgi:hypothetical protein